MPIVHGNRARLFYQPCTILGIVGVRDHARYVDLRWDEQKLGGLPYIVAVGISGLTSEVLTATAISKVYCRSWMGRNSCDIVKISQFEFIRFITNHVVLLIGVVAAAFGATFIKLAHKTVTACPAFHVLSFCATDFVLPIVAQEEVSACRVTDVQRIIPCSRAASIMDRAISM